MSGFGRHEVTAAEIAIKKVQIGDPGQALGCTHSRAGGCKTSFVAASAPNPGGGPSRDVEPVIIEGQPGGWLQVECRLEDNVPVLTIKNGPNLQIFNDAADLSQIALYKAVKTECDRLREAGRNNSVVIDLQPGTALKSTRLMMHLLDDIKSRKGRLYCTAGPEEQAALAMVGFTNLPKVLRTRTKQDALNLAMQA